MTTELPKTYDPAAVEAAAYKTWVDENAFHAEPSAGGTPYTIVIPPPNVTGALHLGHAIDNTLQDILIRRKRMQGFNTLWMPGIDHAGIATQAVVEKELKEKQNKTRHDLGREELVKRIWAWKEQYGNRIIDQLKRLGASCDWARTRFTLDEQCARAVRETFFKLFKAGLIYRGERLVNWDAHLQTAVSDDEIFHETVKGGFWTFRYPVKGSTTGEFIRFSTTRPETMLGDTAVAVHPDDPRYQHLIGKMVTVPLVNRDIPIIADPILVDPKLGTGAVKVTPAHDKNDYECGLRHNLPRINILTPDGKINQNGGKYAGMSRFTAREWVTEDMKKLHLFEGKEERDIELAHSDRSKTPIEPYMSDQWFVKMGDIPENDTGGTPAALLPSPGTPGEGRGGGLAQLAIDAVNTGRVRFFPDRYAKTYLDWLGEKRDWCISRQLWWGHRIPVWRRTFASGKDLHDAIPREFPRWVTEYRADGSLINKDAVSGEETWFVCVRDDKDDEVIGTLEAQGFIRDPDVLDTWFSSALWPHSTLGWPEETPELKLYYPTNVLVTARDIITLWVARMVITGQYNMGAIPFPHVFIHPTILDGNGQRMSKTAGNGVDPVDIIENQGADALRFTLTSMATETQDARLPVKLICPHCATTFPNPDGKQPLAECPKCGKAMTRPMGTAVGTADAPMGRATSDKFDIGRNFCNKLWNAARFALSNLELTTKARSDEEETRRADKDTGGPPVPQSTMLDRWILSRLARTVAECDAALDNYHFDQYAKACYDFFWRDLCDWYIEAIKPAFKDPARAPHVAAIMATCLDAALRLMHPMIPFITETIFWKLNEVWPERGMAGKIELPAGPRLIKAAWPKADASAIDEPAEAVVNKLQELIGAIRNLRNDYKVDPRKSVSVSISAPADVASQIEANRGTIELLGTCTIKEARPDLPAVANAARATAAGCDLYVEGMADAKAEEQRSSKRREELTKQIEAMRKRLSNESYTAKAPPHLVQQTRDQLAAAEAELAKLG